MALCRIEKDKETTNEGSENDVRGTANKQDSEFQKKVAQAIAADDLCYNCETGFHYMK